MKWTNVLIIGFVVIGLLAFFYVANRFSGGEKGITTEKPITTCQPENTPPEQQKCYWTAHIHATVRIFMKGQAVPLGFEKGNLESAHTHAEPDKIHWHGLIPVDSKTKEKTDWSPLAVSKLALGGREGTPKFIVNGQEVNPSHIWKDGDTIEIRYE